MNWPFAPNQGPYAERPSKCRRMDSPIKSNDDYLTAYGGLPAALIAHQAGDYVRRQCPGAKQISSAMAEIARIVPSRFRRMLCYSIAPRAACDAVVCGARPNRIPVSTSIGSPPRRYRLNFHWPRASVITFA